MDRKKLDLYEKLAEQALIENELERLRAALLEIIALAPATPRGEMIKKVAREAQEEE